MTPRPIWFRYSPKNSYSIAALLPLVEAGLSRLPREGIMLYSFATAQAGEVYAEVDRARAAGAVKEGIFVYEAHPCRSFPGDCLPEEGI